MYVVIDSSPYEVHADRIIEGGLVRSKYREDQKKGVELFREIYRDDGERGRECVYYLALGYYRLGDLPMSRKFNDILLKSEPDNMQARSLSSLIDKRLNRDGLLGVALVGGAVATVGVFLALLLRKK
eukprot:Partr_v1_DN22700_c0_g1_i1_m5363 putative fission 1